MGSVVTSPHKDEQRYIPGTVAPSEGPQKPQQAPASFKDFDLGPNNEKLEKHTNGPRIIAALRDLVLGYRVEGIVSRRWEMRRQRQAHMYWMGVQNGIYNPADWNWHMPYGTDVGLGFGVEEGADAETPRYDYVTNIYQAFGLSFIALMIATVPTTKFYPASAQSEEDITTAKAADDVRKYVDSIRGNQPKKLLKKISWLYWLDGKVGGYVRWVADGNRFGYEEVNSTEPDLVKAGEDAYVCPQCGNESPAPGQCPQCGQQLSPDDFKPADYIAIPKVQSTQKVPKGNVVKSIIPGLEFHTPPWADCMDEFPYLQWNLEVHKAKLRASFPEAASKINAGGTTSADDAAARAWRISVRQGLPLTQPGDALQNLVTFSRTWIRPWSFWELEDKDTREMLMELYPDGCYVAFAGEAYCESRNESMDDHWAVSQAMEGDGQNRPSAGDSMVQVQDQYNALSNIEQESADYGIPFTIVDSELINMDAINSTTAEPAAIYPTKTRMTAQDDIQRKVWQSQPATVPDQFVARREEMMGPLGQFLTGIMPASFGGKMQGNDTAAAYEMAREQALGRIGLFYSELKLFTSDMDLLAVETFRDNATGDIEIPDEQEGGTFESKWLRMADLKGNIQVFEESDEGYPALPSQVRAAVKELLADPNLSKMLLGNPANLRILQDMWGMQDFAIEGADASIKADRIIKLLLKSPPGMLPVQPRPDLDDLPAMMSEIRRWYQSDAGQTVELENPQGLQNIVMFFQACKQAMGPPPAPEQKPPSESINFKDVPPEAQAQMLGQAGIHVDPQVLVAQAAQNRADEQAKAADQAANAASRLKSIGPSAG